MRVTPHLLQITTSSSASLPSIAQLKANCRKVVCIGRNYADHITELKNERPKRPFFFLKPPSSILLPPSSSSTTDTTQQTDSAIRIPHNVTVHHEIELGIFLSRRLHNLSPTDTTTALSSIHAYVTAIDLTARNVQDAAKRKSLPWTLAKGFDTFLPLSHAIAPAALPDPYAATLHLRVNGATRQRDRAELMLFRIPEILSEISRAMTLEAGDLVLTGTPKGVGPVREGERVAVGLEREGGEVVEGSAVEWDVKGWEGDYEFVDD